VPSSGFNESLILYTLLLNYLELSTNRKNHVLTIFSAAFKGHDVFVKSFFVQDGTRDIFLKSGTVLPKITQMNRVSIADLPLIEIFIYLKKIIT
jgi:hypothetical protein